ncbi:MAG: hypothetical protein E6J85_10375 [Deltaproteobacteria bacterium]|nr:MAG: hypothetical protein E6J85_10375 [Deltaproteobacteria bacterium]
MNHLAGLAIAVPCLAAALTGGNASAAPADVRICFKADSPLSGPTYGGDRWVSSSSYGRLPSTSLLHPPPRAAYQAGTVALRTPPGSGFALEGFREMLTLIDMAGSAVVAMLYVAILAAVLTRKQRKRSEAIAGPLRALEELHQR